MIKFIAKNLIEKFHTIFPSNNNFFKKSGTETEYVKIFEDIKVKNYPNINKYEVTSNYIIDKEWFNNLALHTQVVKKKSNINYQHGRVIYSTLREYLDQNYNNKISIFESGTARGFSSVCMSKALIDNQSIGIIHTVDIVPNSKKIYWNIVDDHTRGKLTRNELLNQWSEELKSIKFYTMKSSEFFEKFNLKRINFAFLDAVHDEENISKEFEYVRNRQIKGDMIIFDDYDDQYKSLKKYLKEVVPQSYDVIILESDKNRHYLVAKKKS